MSGQRVVAAEPGTTGPTKAPRTGPEPTRAEGARDGVSRPAGTRSPRAGVGAPLPPDGAEVLQRLVRDAAAALGVELSSLTVRCDGEAAAEVRARGGAGLSAGRTVLLDGVSLAGSGRRRREVVAHEVVHVTQRDEGGRPSGRLRPSVATAEREAHHLAARFADGRTVPRPLATLPGDHIAADVDWAGLPELRAALDAYDEVVADARPHEWQTLTEALDGDGSIPARQIDLVVNTLAPLPLPVIRALLHRLAPRSRWDVVRQLSAEHYEVHRPVVIGAFAALDATHAQLVEPGHLRRLDLRGLTTLEHDVLLLALSQVPATVVTALLQAESGDPESPRLWHTLVEGPGISVTPVTFVEGLATEQATADLETAEVRAARAAEAARLVRELAALINQSDDDAIAAVGRIARIEPDLRPAVVEGLEGQGHIARLLDRIDDHDGQGGPLTSDDLGTVLAARPTAANLATISDRLSGGIFGWDWTEDIAITEADAMVAFWAIAALPLDVRERLLRANDTDTLDRSDQGDALDKMERNLPDWFVTGPAYRSLAVDRDRHGARFERGSRHAAAWAREGTAGFLVDLRRLITAGRHADALAALDTGVLGEEPSRLRAPRAEAAATRRIEMTDEVRAALVDRLDALDVMDDLLERLPEGIRQGRDHRMQLLRVCAARSVPNLLRHLSSLLHVGLFDWAVRSWEADLAYVLFRALPRHEQERFPRLGDITAEMSADIRTWSGTNLLDAATATARLRQVQAQLADDTLWRASRAGQLRVLVGMAVALGDRRTPFDRSRALEAYRDPSLAEIVRDFHLYDPTVGRTSYTEETLANTPWYNEGPFYYGTLIGGFLWVALRDAMAGDFAIDLSGRISHREFDLNEMADLLGGHAGGARFAERRDTERGRERNPDVTERANRANLHYDQRSDTLHVGIPELALEGLGVLRSTWAVNTGAIRVHGLTIDATFDTSNLRHPRSLEVSIPRASVADLLVTTPQSAHGVARIGLEGFRMSGSPSTSGERATTGRGLWTSIPVLAPVLEYCYLLAQAVGLGMNASTQLGQGLTELRSAHVGVAGVDIRGLLVGGVPIEQVTMGPITLAWGGTRAAYLQEQERALVARLAATPEGPARVRLTDQLARVRDELPTALAEDRRLDELIRRSYRDPSSLTAADHAEIAALQRGPGGLVVDTGEISLRGLGDIAERATIARISGEVTAQAATGGRMTDAALADRFRTAGPPVDTSGRLTAAGRLDLGQVDVVLRPPTIETLERWRVQAEAAGGTNRVARIDAAIAQRRELDELRAAQDARIRAGGAPSQADAARIEQILSALATTIHAEDAYAEVDLNTGTLTLGAARVHGGPIETDTFGAGRFDVEGVRIPIATDPSRLPLLLLAQEHAQGMSPEARAQLYGDRARDTVTGAGLDVRRATLTDIRVGAGDSTVGELTITGLRGGAVAPVPEGVRIEGLHVDSVVGRGASIRMGSHALEATGGVSIEGIDASFTILLDESHGFAGARVDRACIETVRVLQPETPVDAATVAPGATSPAPISYTNLASGFSIELFDGSLGGIWVEDLLLDASGEELVVRSGAEGERQEDRPLAGIERIDGLRLAAAVGGWRVSTTVSSPAAGAGAAGAITVGEARQGGWFLDLNGLRLTDAEVRSPDGSVRIRRLDWAHSHLRYDGQGLYLDALDIPRIEVGRLRWRIGTAGVLESTGGATIEGITANARARLTEREGERHVSELVLPELRVRSITAEDLRYTDGPIDIRLRRLGPTDPAPVTVSDLVVRDVRWAPGEVVRFDAATGPVGLAVDAGYGGTPRAAPAGRDFGFMGQVYAASLSVSQDETGLAGGIEGLGVAGDVRAAGLGGGHVDLWGLTVPRWTFGGNVFSIPAGAAGALRLGSLELSALHLSAGGATISTGATGNLRLEELQAGFDIHLVDVIRAGAEPTRMVDRIVLHEVDATRLSTTGLTIDVPGAFRTTVSSTGRNTSAVSGIHVRNLDLRAVPRTGPGARGYHLTLAGFDEVRVDRIDLRDLAFAAPIGVTLGEDVPEPTRRAQAQAGYEQYLDDRAAGVATSEDWVAAFADLIDAADGSVQVDLDLPIYALGENLGGRIAADIRIDDGQVDFVELEAQILEELNIADSVIDFVVEGRTLRLRFDPTAVMAVVGAGAGAAIGARGGWVGAGIGAGVGGIAGGIGGDALSMDIVTWDLTPAEQVAARHRSQVRIARLLVPRRGRPSAEPSPVELDLGRMSVSRLDVHLSLSNDTPWRVTLPGGRGWLDFPARALSGLALGVGSGVPGRPQPSPRVSMVLPPARAALSFSLDRLALAGASLNLPIGNLTTGSMTVSDVRNGRIRLERPPLPATPTTASRPHDTGLGMRLVDISGNAGTVSVRDLVLTPGGTGAP